MPALVVPVWVPWPLLSRAVWVRLGRSAGRARQVRREERPATDQLVVAREHIDDVLRQRVVAEVAGSLRAVGLVGRGAEVALVGERRVFGPGAAVEDPEDHALAGLGVATEALVQVIGPDELGAGVREQLLQ